MDYDQESIYYKSSCLYENLNTMLDKILECALQPKTFISKVYIYHFLLFEACFHKKIKEQKIKDESLMRPEENAELLINEKLLETAYGLQGLGLPVQGIESNASKINSEILTKFYMEKFSPDKIYLCASGIKDHNDFVKRVEERMSKIVLGSSKEKRKPTVYKGGVDKIFLDREEFHIALVFQSVFLYQILLFN